ncbi:MAG: thiamine phosphate synthase [Propionibacteriaceae bacterium]
MTALLGLALRLRLARLGWELDASTPDLVDVAQAGLAAGVDLLIVSQGEVPTAELLPQLEQLREVASTPTLLGVRGSTELAVGCAADLRVLGPDDGLVVTARRTLHRWALVGLATGERAALTQLDADFLWLGAPAEPGLVRAAARAAPATAARSRPWFAVTDSESADELIDAGAYRIAVRELVVDREPAVAGLGALAVRLRQVWTSDPALRRVVVGAPGQ